MSVAQDGLAKWRADRQNSVLLLKQVNAASGYDKLSLEDRLRGAVCEVLLEMSPAWIEVMRTMPVSRKLEASNRMFLTARDMLVNQGLRAGLALIQARAQAAHRLLDGNAW